MIAGLADRQRHRASNPARRVRLPRPAPLLGRRLTAGRSALTRSVPVRVRPPHLSFTPGSSKGRTRGSEPRCVGSSPAPGTNLRWCRSTAGPSACTREMRVRLPPPAPPSYAMQPWPNREAPQRHCGSRGCDSRWLLQSRCPIAQWQSSRLLSGGCRFDSCPGSHDLTPR